MPKVWFTADTHFGHDAIREYCARPFATVEAMDTALVTIWNSVVQPGDIVWHLGDFALGRKVDERWLQRLFRRLHGQKSLVIGNHDGPATKALPWQSQHQIAECAVNGQRIVMCHYPLRTWAGSVHGAIHLHGHEHGRAPPWPGACDVGVDAWQFAPVSLDRIRQSMAK